MKILGLTGTTGAGKGEVSRVFASLGAFVCDADEIYHRLLNESGEMCEEITAEFGDISRCGKIDRRKLAEKVFDDKSRLSRLNEITHRYVLSEVDRLLSDAEKKGVKVGVIDAPMLYESGADKKCSAVIGVVAPKDLRLNRIMERDGLTENEALARINAQNSDEWFYEKCDIIIVNEKDRESLTQKAKDIYKTLVNEEEII